MWRNNWSCPDSDNTWLYLPFTNSGDVTAGGDCAGGFNDTSAARLRADDEQPIHVHINSGNVTAAGSYAGASSGR